MLTFKMAVRSIFRQKRRTALTMLAMIGGFALNSFSIGWAEGSYNYVINMFTRNQLGHVQVHAKGYLDRPSLYRTVDDYEKVGAAIEGIEDVDAWAPRLYSAGLVSLGEKTAGMRIIGVDPALENAATNFDKKVVEGDALSQVADHEVLLGRGLAKVLRARVGDTAVVVSQAADGSIANDMYTVVGIVESGDELSDLTAFYLHLEDAQELLVLEGRVHEVAVVVDRLSRVAAVRDAIEAALDNPELQVSPWQVFARAFYTAMMADKRGNWISLFVIILIVAVGVLNTVLMTVLERTREYGVLRAIGTTPVQVFRLVLYEVLVMALISVVIGAGIGATLNYIFSVYGIAMPQSISYGGMEFTHGFAEVNALSLWVPAITVLVAALGVSIFPAIKAARVSPAKAMRTH